MRPRRRIRLAGEKARGWSFALSLIALLISFSSCGFTVWSFWFHELRVKNEVIFSLVQYECFPWGQDGSMAVRAFVSNNGTTPVAIIRTDWVLSDNIAGTQNIHRQFREIHDFTPPIVVEGGAIQVLDYKFPCREDSCSDRVAAAAHFYEGLPDDITIHPNIHIYLRNTLVVYCVDGGGDLRETKIPLGDFSFSGTGGLSEHPYGAKLTNMPIRADLVQGEPVTDKFRNYRIWKSGMYYTVNNETVARSALRALTPDAEAILQKFLQSADGLIADEDGDTSIVGFGAAR